MALDNSFHVVPTGVSGAFWCNPDTLAFEEARSPKGQICWLDELLSGGVLIPGSAAGQPRALTMLLTGPPGTGKSTLATELCYRWARANAKPLPFHSYYATTEANPRWLIDNARRLWGDGVDQVFKVWGQALGRDQKEGVIVDEYSSGDIPKTFPREGPSLISSREKLARLLGLYPRSANLGENIDERPYDVIVIDSLNVISGEDRKKEWLTEIFDVILNGPKLIILVLDSTTGGPSRASEFWEYICDIVIRLDRTHPISPTEGYMLRTIEIVKARYQHHAWGVHQLKIYEAYDAANDEGRPLEPDAYRLMRAHPFRREGGIFIYPSIHYVLSTYKRSDPTLGPIPVETPIESLTELLEGGFPEGRCTAFLGARGGHKSYLGFMQVVSRVLPKDNDKDSECGLIVSLRDDVGVTLASINKILEDSKYSAEAIKNLWQSEFKKRLEIMYFPPGNITPEEFLHRILLNILRLKQQVQGGNANVTLLFNSLDQLAARFPLCAKEPVFIAALLQLLSANRVTSLFVSASERPEDATYHGLDSIAELILNFEHERNLTLCDRKRAIRTLDPEGHLSPEEIGKLAKTWLAFTKKPDLIVRVVRHAGGHPAGARGILELVGANHPLRKQGLVGEGLHCFVLDPHEA
jgi:KaiC/GvpD/RAD55 family RecA-like ATPase